MAKAVATKYGKHVIREPFYKASEDFKGAQVFAYHDEDKGGLTFEYHCINDPNWSIKKPRIHDTWELLCFIGGNPKKIMDLGAKVSICLSDSKEEHILTGTTVVTIPPGLKHGPIAIKQYTKPFVLLRILMTKEYEAKKPKPSKEEEFRINMLKQGSPNTTKDGKKFWANIVQGPFLIEGEPGNAGASLVSHHNEYKNGTTLGYHSMKYDYHAPIPHSHNFHESLCVLGGNPENLNDLGGAKVKICLGKEQEEHTFNTAGIISMPAGLQHCPLTIEGIKASKPVIFLEISTIADYATNV
jgi:hypothetical protein